MDRTNRYLNTNENTQTDYLAELICLIASLIRSDVFVAVFSVVTFIFSFVFVVGVCGAIELGTASYTVGAPVLVMMLCALFGILRARR